MNQVYNKSAFVLQPWLVRQVWNSLGNDLRDPDLNIASIGRLLKSEDASVPALFGEYKRIRGTVR